jgi:biopolymer transport protein ExbD
VNASINVTPMVDVMLVLLIIFMVVTPMLKRAIPVQLAKTNNPVAMPDADRSDAFVVALARDGTVFLGNEVVPSKALTDKLSAQLAAKSNRTVFVRSDARVRYKFLVDVVDRIREAGADEVGLLTEQRHRRFAPPQS